MKTIIFISIFVIIGWIFKPAILNTFFYDINNNIVDKNIPIVSEKIDNISDEEIESIMHDYLEYENKLYRPKKTSNKNRFKCDGRKYCRQMNSYNEAEYFLKHCPNVEIDEDGDGIPCEKEFKKYY